MGAYSIGVPLPRAEEACQRRLESLERRARIPLLFRYWDEISRGGESRIHIILGSTGSGKSTLALLFLGWKYSCDIEEIFDKVVWRPDDFLEKYDEGRPLLVWDDAGVWLRLLSRMNWDPLSITINSIFDLGRLQVPLVIMTMVTDRDVPRALRYNSYIYRSRTRVWRVGYDEAHQAYRAKAVTQFRREKQDWTQSYWDASSEYVYKFYHFKEGDPYYTAYLELRRQYAKVFLKFSKNRLRESRLWELLKQG